MRYDPVAYWRKRGRTFEAEARGHTDWGGENEPLMALLRTLRFGSVLEVGCGFGRVAELILAERPEVRYTGLDVSQRLVESARRRLPRQEFIRADLATYRTPWTWDLVLSVLCLGHILPNDVAGVVARMRGWAARDLVIVEWDETGKATDYQFAHDYRDLLPDAHRTPIGDLSIYHLAR